ncbi:MAG: TIGR03557 family F420-dependent LLM class oxidoreductase [Chloroflexota bacterium]|nr:TIGR03557 family F420-dependent LLM class oxidoreductase [Chloroflexota bacterium]PLS79405.1 MAG: LLM class F420-dependent oxidoreductase [Chloroflexota bacterium]
MTFGYAAMFEQFTPTELLRFCEVAEANGFTSVMASDHFHPWTPQQGQSAFVWSWMGALGERTQQRFGTGVTPPGYRYHPAIIAQAAATLEAMYPGRFWLGLGAGEALNEHIVGTYWPEAPARLDRLMEGIEVIQKLFSGKVVKYSGKHISLESARLYTMPQTPPPIYVATSGPIMSERTGRLCDGLITVGAADTKIKMLMERFEKGAREAGKDPSTMPRIIQLHVSWAETQAEAEQNALQEWPNGGMPFPKGDIRNPEDFEAMAKFVHLDNFKNRVLISPDLEAHRAHIQHFVDLGFTEVYVHNVGRNQEAFLAAYGQAVVPQIRWATQEAVADDR